MAGKKYVDADGDFSRYLKMSDLGSQMLLSSSSSKPEAQNVPPAAHPVDDDARHQQPLPASNFLCLSLTAGSEHRGAPTTSADTAAPAKVPASGQASGDYDALHVQGFGAGSSSSWTHDMPAPSVIPSPANTTRISSASGTERSCAYGSDQGQLQPTMFYSTIVDIHGHARRGERLYNDLSERMHEWVQNFMASGVDTTKHVPSGQVTETQPGLCVTNYMDSPPHNDAQEEAELDTLSIISAGSGDKDDEEEATDSSQLEDVVDMAFDGAGFHPYILESSLVIEYDPASGTSATMYPSLRDTLPKKGQPKKRRGDSSKDPKLSRVSRKPRSCSKDKAFHKHSFRIDELYRKIIKLEEAAKRASCIRQFIQQRIEMHRQEMAQLLSTIDKALQRKSNNGAGQ